MPDPVTRVGVVTEIPTPYRLPLFERIAARSDFDLEVLFCARSEPDRPWDVSRQLERVPHRFLSGWSPKVRTRRNTFVYEINLGVVRVLRERAYDVLVVAGYSVFAEQAAIAYAQLSRTPYLLHTESHHRKGRSGAKRALKQAILPRIVGRAAGGLAVGSLAAQYLESYGLDPARIRIFPNTIDVAAYAAAARRARGDAQAVQARLGVPDRFIFFAGRLVEVKGIRELLEAHRLAGPEAPQLVVAGDGPLAHAVARAERVTFLGFRQPAELIELFALAERTAVPSLSEPWGVVVNEALACGSPVVATDAVGAAFDLVRTSSDGIVVPAGDIDALRRALLAPLQPHEPGTGPVAHWDYDFGVDQFAEAIALARSS